MSRNNNNQRQRKACPYCNSISVTHQMRLKTYKCQLCEKSFAKPISRDVANKKDGLPINLTKIISKKLLKQQHST
jgi:ribosomal protein L37AE/L43A